MLKNMKISRKLNALIGIIICSLVVVGAVSFIQSRSVEKMIVTLVDKDVELLIDLNGIYAEGLQTGQATRNVLINPNDEKAMKNYRDAHQNFLAMTEQSLLSAPASMRDRLKKVKELWEEDHKLKTEIQASGQSRQKERSDRIAGGYGNTQVAGSKGHLA